MKIIEFIGLPGSGKSTLRTILMENWRSPSVLALEECILLFSGFSGKILLKVNPRLLDSLILLLRFSKIYRLYLVKQLIRFQQSQIIRKHPIVNHEDLELLEINLKTLSESSSPTSLKYDISNYVKNLMSTYVWISSLSVSKIVVPDEGLTSNVRGMSNIPKALIISFIERYEIWFIYCFCSTDQAMNRLAKRKFKEKAFYEMNDIDSSVFSRSESRVDFLRREKLLAKLLHVITTDHRLLLQIDNSLSKEELDKNVSHESYYEITKRLFDISGN